MLSGGTSFRGAGPGEESIEGADAAATASGVVSAVGASARAREVGADDVAASPAYVGTAGGPDGPDGADEILPYALPGDSSSDSAAEEDTLASPADVGGTDAVAGGAGAAAESPGTPPPAAPAVGEVMA